MTTDTFYQAPALSGTGLEDEVRTSPMGEEGERRLPNLGDQTVKRLVSN